MYGLALSSDRAKSATGLRAAANLNRPTTLLRAMPYRYGQIAVLPFTAFGSSGVVMSSLMLLRTDFLKGPEVVWSPYIYDMIVRHPHFAHVLYLARFPRDLVILCLIL